MIISKGFMPLLFAVVVLLVGIWQGFTLALKKPLWNDEIYSQVSSVEGRSWAYMWTGMIREGNNSPLFYSVQKLVCSAFGYQSVDLWNKDDVNARFILRIAPVLCMALGLALIVGFFSYYYSLVGGVVALIVAISSYMVWYYWAEARPYAMVFLSTAMQALACLYYYRFDPKKRFWMIGAVNFLVALVSSLSVIQIFASLVLLWFNGCRRVWPLVWCVLLPLLVAFGYYKVADHYAFQFMPHGMPLALIGANIPSGRLGAFFALPLMIWAWDRYMNRDRSFSLWPFFAWSWLTLAGYVLFLAWLYVLQTPATGFEVSNRYLMALTPLGIVAVTAGIMEFTSRPKVLPVKLLVWVGIAALILPRMVKVYRWWVQ